MMQATGSQRVGRDLATRHHHHQQHQQDIHTGFPGGSVVKNTPVNAGEVGSIPGLGRYPGEGNGNPL